MTCRAVDRRRAVLVSEELFGKSDRASAKAARKHGGEAPSESPLFQS